MDRTQPGPGNGVNPGPLETFCGESAFVLSELRRSGQLTDAFIKVDSTVFPIHRAVMSTCSPYFRALFTSEGFNTSQREINISGVSADIMSIIIDFAYTGKATITATNVEQLLPAADQFHVNGLLKTCCDFLIAELSPENCIGIYQFSVAYFCRHLEKVSFRYLMQNFPAVSTNSNEFIQLPLEELCRIIQQDELNIRNEENVFTAVTRWIDFDPEHRKYFMLRLLQSMRLGRLSKQYFIDTVKTHPYVVGNEECAPIIREALDIVTDFEVEDKPTEFDNPLTKPRLPFEAMFAIGGWSGGSPTNMLEVYDTRLDNWSIVECSDVVPRAYHGTAAVGSRIYVIGGFDGMEYFNSCRCFDALHMSWVEVAPMNNKRCYVSVTCLDGLIYAMGGFDGYHRQNSVERYNPSANQWTLIAPMNQQRSDASATSLQGKVYICGGFNGQECLSTAEVFDPQLGQWSLIAPMTFRRSGISIIAHRNQIYALGGFNGITRMRSGERYNPTNNAWQAIPPMYTPRSNFAIEVVDEMVFAIGGFNGTTTIFNVECYDEAADEWYDAADMNVYRSALSACVVHALPNIREYIYKDFMNEEMVFVVDSCIQDEDLNDTSNISS